MAESQYAKLDIAYEYLETAMQLYIEERNYFSAIHLAAAAEELFGRHLPEAERMSHISLKAQIAFDVIYTGMQIGYDAAQRHESLEHKTARKIVFDPKNEIKHMKDDGSNSNVTINPVSVARKWIEHALINFEKVRELRSYKLHARKSPIMWKFQDYRTREDERLGAP